MQSIRKADSVPGEGPARLPPLPSPVSDSEKLTHGDPTHDLLAESILHASWPVQTNKAKHKPKH